MTDLDGFDPIKAAEDGLRHRLRSEARGEALLRMFKEKYGREPETEAELIECADMGLALGPIDEVEP